MNPKNGGHKTLIFARAVLCVALLLFALFVIWQGMLYRGADSPEELVRTYLQALHTRDEPRIQRLVLSGYDPKKEISKRISQFEGVAPNRVSATFITNQIAPYLVDVDLAIPRNTEIGATQIITDRLTLQSNGGRWYLVLGVNRGSE